MTLLGAAVMLTACAGARDAGPVGQTVYAADIEPTVGRAQAVSVAGLPGYAAVPAEDPNRADVFAQNAVAAAEAQQPRVGSAAAVAPTTARSAPAASATVSSLPAVAPVAGSGGQVAAAPSQVAAPTRATPTIVRQPAPASPIARAPEPAPPTAEEVAVVETVRVIPDPSGRPERPTAYPNLADVPDNPGNLPTPDETAAIRAELEADRDAINQGETPPSVTDGSIMRIARERLGSLASSSSAGGSASVTFDAGSSALRLDGLATLQAVALTQRETGDDVRLVGFAYAASEANRPVALGIALDRANAVARALVSYGADPAAISVFANARTDATQQDLASGRRVDISFQ